VPEVKKLIAREVDAVNKTLSQVERVKRFELLPRRFYEEEGDVTPTKKVKRRNLEKRYADLVESLYRDSPMDLVETYARELRFARKPIGRTLLIFLVVGLAVLPWWAPGAWLTRGAVVCLYAIGVLGQNLLIGYAGQLSFGQAGLLAIGAYS